MHENKFVALLRYCRALQQKYLGWKQAEAVCDFWDLTWILKNGDAVTIVFRAVKLLFDCYEDLEPPAVCVVCAYPMLDPI